MAHEGEPDQVVEENEAFILDSEKRTNEVTIMRMNSIPLCRSTRQKKDTSN